ncbi:hypothetical protein I317_04923 [Kwoniella heveanensis CBS 569]|nr:hypothetical protein I317_04923 [Kwoniella heveanensis CBS 569]
MSRRRASAADIFQPSRRILRFCALSFLIIAGLWVLSSRSDLDLHSGSSIRSESWGYLNGKRQVDQASFAAPEQHPIDSFVQTFPKLRKFDQLEPLGHQDEGIIERTEGNESQTGRTPFDWPRTKKLFVFGDSYLKITERMVLMGVTIKNSVFHDFHVLQYWNFAKPGATVSHSVLPPGLESYGTYETQINDFEELFTPAPGPRNVNWQSNDTLFVVFFGINDMRDDLHEGEGLDIPSTTKALADSLLVSTRRLYSVGARSFLFLTLPPIQYSPKYNLPGQVGHDIQHRVDHSVSSYNAFLRKAVDDFEQEQTDANVMLFDLEKYWRLILDYPELFGMTDCARFAMTVDGKRPNLGRMGLW